MITNYKAILFYGPPGSGKGTQMSLLAEYIKTEPLDVGHFLRSYIKNNPENPAAKSIESRISEGLPILTEDYFFVLKNIIDEKLSSGKIVLFDKPGGSLPPETQWFSDLINSKKIPTLIFHIHTDLQTSIERASQRWFVKNSSQSFPSMEEALKSSPNLTLKDLSQRVDDASSEKIQKRYDELYQKNTQEVLTILNSNPYYKVIKVPENLSITQTADFIKNNI